MHPKKEGRSAAYRRKHAMESQHPPGNLLGEIARIVERVHLPGFNAAAVLEARRKDVAALSEANRIAFAGVQELAQKQSEVLQKTLQQLRSLLQEGHAAEPTERRGPGE
jgi:hypothetical protein